mmetsp:Transcript_116217/g.281988  ORF Transcript_116217/g.281988 Transcript_116217/m.281988 type:complete len:172 (-) Transcript_116217:339-854(-)
MMFAEKQNANPLVFTVSESTAFKRPGRLEDLPEFDDDAPSVDGIDEREVFELIRGLQDPEHPLTLEQLNVTRLEHISVDNESDVVDVTFTPTIPHCSMATLIGLCIRVKLLRSLPRRFKVAIRVTPGTHASEVAVNKQLNDKERVAAALENTHLLGVVNKCLAPSAAVKVR